MRFTRLLCEFCGFCAVVFMFVGTAHAAGDDRLVQAVKNRDQKTIQLLLKQRVDVTTRGRDGSTALHWAAQWDDVNTAQLLLRAGAKVDALDDYGVTALSLASTNGSAVMVKTLLAAGANPNLALDTGETPLMSAAHSGGVEAVTALIELKADVNAQEASKGQTALMWAAAESHAPVVKVLLAHGADVKGKSKSGFAPIVFAARGGDLDTARALLDAGADVNQAAADGTTALTVATIRGLTAFGEFLLDRGANPNVGPGFTPLHWASGRWDLGDRNHELDKTHVMPTDEEWFPLHGLRAPAKLAFVKVLVAHGADVNAKARSNPRYGGGRGGRGNLVGGTPFLMAAMAGDTDVMRFLVENGAKPLETTEDGTTPLMVAAGLLGRMGDSYVNEDDAFAAVKLCVELGADVNAVNWANGGAAQAAGGSTALHGAAWRGPVGSTRIIQFLVEHGADMNVKDYKGWSPLTIAEGLYSNNSNTRSIPATELLRKLGAAPSPPDIDRDSDALVEVPNSVVLTPKKPQ